MFVCNLINVDICFVFIHSCFHKFSILSENSTEIPHKCCLSFLLGISTFYRENCLPCRQSRAYFLQNYKKKTPVLISYEINHIEF